MRAIAMDLVRADGSRMPVLVNSAAAHRRRTAGRSLVRTTIFDATDRKEYETELLAARRRAEQATALGAVGRAGGRRAGRGVRRRRGRAGRRRRRVRRPSPRPRASSGRSTPRPASCSGPRLAGAVGPPDDLPPAQGTPARGRPAPRGLGRPAAGGRRGLPAAARGARRGAGVLVLAPLVALDRTLGVLALRLGAARAPDPEELRLLQTLGQQAGLALERARLYDEQRSVATTLQHSMLPGSMPDDPRLGLSACYRPAVDVLEVGGDWYDAFLLDADRVAVVVGDVVGRGAARRGGDGPAAQRGPRAGDASTPDRPCCSPGSTGSSRASPAADTATMAYAEVDLRDGSVRYACAGHPPPVVVDAAGEAVAALGRPVHPARRPLRRGRRGRRRAPPSPTARGSCSTPTAWWNGGTSRSTTCIDALAELLGSWADRPFDTLADGVTDAVLGPERTGDDVCLLALAYRAAASGQGHEPL